MSDSGVVEVVRGPAPTIEIVKTGGPMGPQGPVGPQGPQGPTGEAEEWLSGTGDPAAALGDVGDWYLDTVSNQVHEKVDASTWEFRTSIEGAQGPQGDVGPVGPQGPQGVPGPQDLSAVPLLIPNADTRNAFNGPTGRVLSSGAVTGDTQPRIQWSSDGVLTFGPGNAPPDTPLYRGGPGSLTMEAGTLTLGTLTAQANVQLTSGTSQLQLRNLNAAAIGVSMRRGGDANDRFCIDSDGKLWWGDGTAAVDTTLYRLGPNNLAQGGALNIGITGPGVLSLQSNGYVSARFASAAGNATFVSRLASGDTVDRFQLLANGTMQWGPGTAAIDCTLFRNGPGELRTTDTLLAAMRAANSSLAFSAHVTGDAQRRFGVRADGYFTWSDGTNPADTVLYRRGAKEIGLSDTALTVQRTNTTDLAYRSFLVTGDNAARLAITADGGHTWGTGTGAGDTTLYRGTTDQLKTDDLFYAVGGLMVGNGSLDTSAWAAVVGTTSKDHLALGSGTQYLRLGTDASSNVYIAGNAKHVGSNVWNYVNTGAYGGKAAALALTASASFRFASGGVDPITWTTGPVIDTTGVTVSGGLAFLARTASASNTITYAGRVSGDSADRFQLLANGQHNWGDGTNPADLTLARGAANRLHLGTTAQKGALRAYGGVAGDNVFEALVTTDAQLRLQVSAQGSLFWGSGAAVADTNISRSAVARLALVGMLTTTLGVATMTKAGTPVDADWATAPPDGTIVIDTTASKIWARVGGAWKGAVLS